jgi:hypothetical protein
MGQFTIFLLAFLAAGLAASITDNPEPFSS